MTLRAKLIDDSRKAHANWFSCFSQSEINLLTSIGITCGADHNFFKQEILNIFDALSNRKLRAHPNIYHRFVNRYLDLIPEHIRVQVDRKLITEDKTYCAWLFNRQMFIFDYLTAKDGFKNKTSKYIYLLWAPLIDIHSPKDCCKFQNKVFHVNDFNFEKLAVEHWSRPRRGCRCSLIALTESKAKSRQQEHSGDLNGK